MVALRISSLTKEHVKIPIEITQSGAAIDPTGFTVQMAFMTAGEPASGDWKTSDWETAGTSYLARCLVGPGGSIVLADGTYSVWLKVQGSPEIPVRRVGTLVVE